MGLITSVDFCFAKKKLQKKNPRKRNKFQHHHHHSTKKEASVLACLLACIFWNFAVLDLRRSSSFWAMRVGGINDRRFSFSFLGLVCG